MGHLVVFADFIILAVGMGVAAAFFRLHRASPSAETFWRLALFLAFTFTMSVAALGAYFIVNIGFGPFETRLPASLVLLGSAAMLFVLPHGSRARTGRRRGGKFTAFWAFMATIPLAGATAILFLTDWIPLMSIIGISFIPFFAAILYALSMEAAASPKTAASARRSGEAWVALAILLAIAAIEITWTLRHPPTSGYFMVTLPVAYLYVCRSAWRDRSGPKRGSGSAETPTIPEALAKEKGLTERELQIARGILEGRSNKELAADLGIAENTIRNHIYNLYRKLGIQKRLDLVVLVRKYQPS